MSNDTTSHTNHPSHTYVGRVRGVIGQIVRVDCDSEYRPKLQELLTVREDATIRLEVYAYENLHTIYCLLLSDVDKVTRDMEVVSTGEKITIPVGRAVLGRVIDLYGEAIDGRPPIKPDQTRVVYRSYEMSKGMQVKRPDTVLETGIKTIDFFAPLLRGGKMALVGGAGVGKTTLQEEILRNVVYSGTGVSVFAGIGERIREGHALWTSLEEHDVLDRTALIFGHINKNAAVRSLTAASAATLVEYFRDEAKQDVLFFVDNVFRFLQAGSELSTLLSELPSEFGYQPTLQSEIANFENRLYSTQDAAVTSVQTVYVPADEFGNPAVSATMPHMDAVVVLSRDMTYEGRYPAVDPFDSTSTALNPVMVGEAHYKAATEAVEMLNQYKQLSRIVSIVGEEELSIENQQRYSRAQKILNYMTQGFISTANETGREGVKVPREIVVSDIRAILDGVVDKVPAESFLYIGDLASAGLLTPQPESSSLPPS
jgi:F-type H+/Na+-transporting ATPase subunit beta